jgi:TolB-like protein/Flp pilus assembly protein TadD
LADVHLGSWILQPRRQLIADGQRVALGRRALDILSVLAEAEGGIVTKDELFEAVWPGTIVEENALQVHVAALRKALGPEATRLKTIRGVGYQLEIGCVAAGPSESGAEFLGRRVNRLSGTATAEKAVADQARILVLPFTNMSGDPEQEYFADGITEDIITDLSKVSAIAVISRASSFTFKGAPADISGIVERLNVTHVLEGSVRKSANRVRVTVQLIDRASSNHIWGERYDRDLSDIFELQDELSEAIVHALKVKLLPAERVAIESRGTRNSDAYDCYIRARALRASIMPGNLGRAIENYRQALTLDPRFAMAWAGLASAMVLRESYSSASTDAVLSEIDIATANAIKLGPELPETLASRAQRCLFDRDWRGAARCIADFRERQVSDWTVLSHLLLALGRAAEAAEQQFRVRRADPLSFGASWGLQFHLDCAGRFEEAEAEYEKSKDLTGPHQPLHWLALTRAMTLNDPSLVSLRLELLADDTDLLPFGRELTDVLDVPAKGLSVLATAMAVPENQTPPRLDAIAHFGAYLKDSDIALKALRLGLVERRGSMVIDLWHPNFSRIRRDPRFKEIVRDIGLVEYWRESGAWGDFARPVNDVDFELADFIARNVT